MKYLIWGLIIFGLCSSCSKTEEGLIGDWEGKTKRVNSDRDLVETSVKCEIRSNSNTSRSVGLTIAGTLFEFEATENLNTLLYKDRPILNDSTATTFITGSAELQHDTLLHFDHSVYGMKNNALLYSYKEEFDMVRN